MVTKLVSTFITPPNGTEKIDNSSHLGCLNTKHNRLLSQLLNQIFGTVVVSHLVVRLLQIPVICGLNPIIGNIIYYQMY